MFSFDFEQKREFFVFNCRYPAKSFRDREINEPPVNSSESEICFKCKAEYFLVVFLLRRRFHWTNLFSEINVTRRRSKQSKSERVLMRFLTKIQSKRKNV